MLNALSVIAVLLIVVQMAWGLDTQDIVVEWTPEGKKLTMPIPAPTGRLYADEMVDKPYTRYGITNDAQSHNVPTLIRQTP
ncbi:MAG: hypothetical protein KGS09_16750 [Nitrospirae bacterium]|nr:hypothetical protein [Nitrospirota bacterium]MDE3042674.1 hypothetical protein [Nitrospirota bacterium]MDE3051996.1 hypothetical protein [Nitrospirota bacterium]MDE3218057.1 hypothetical protein [Nitrospirota bacterium]